MKSKYKQWLFGYLFIAPTVIGLMVFLIGPVFHAFYISLTKWDNLSPPVFIGLENYTRMFSDPVLYHEVANTFIYTFTTVPIMIILAVIIANMLNMKIPGVGFFRVAFFIPYVTLPVASAMVWESMFNSKFGVVNAVLKLVGMKPVQWLTNPQLVLVIIILMGVWINLGYNIVILLVGIKNIPLSYYEACDIDGANEIQKFMSITVPLLTPQIFFVSITSIIGAIKIFDAIYVFGKSSAVLRDGIRTMVYGIFEKGFTFQEMGYASAESVLLLFIIMLLTIFQFVMQKKWVNY